MTNTHVRPLSFLPLLFVALCVCTGEPAPVFAAPFVATTSVSLTVCGDSIVTLPVEACDDGTNTGAYSDSIAGRNCNPLCSAFGPYCGDGILQTLYGEECDDTNNDSGDLCDATCNNEEDPVVEGGDGGGGGGGGGGGTYGNQGDPDASDEGNIDFDADTDVYIQGKAYPGSTVTILLDGEIEGLVEADSSAEFDYRISGPTPGTATFSFWADDVAGRTSITYSTTFQIVENAVTTLSGVLLPPTLAAVPQKARQGETVAFEGTTVPEGDLSLFINDTAFTEEAIAASDGSWRVAFDTTPLANESFHRAKANVVDPLNAALESSFSQIVSFYIGVRELDEVVTADLNADNTINLVDFSILLFNWNTTNALADLNTDGIVDLADFSIMLFHWTG